MENIYAENVLNYANKKDFDLNVSEFKDKSALSYFDYVGMCKNFTCGDSAKLYIKTQKVEIEIKIKEEVKVEDSDNQNIFDAYNLNGKYLETIIEIKHNSVGCAISIAGMNMLCEKLIGQDIENIKSRFLPSDIYNMFGVHIGLSRSSCAIMCYNCLQDINYKSN